MRAIYWKEMADHFGRKRFLLLLGIVILGVLWGAFIDMETLVVSGSGFFFLDVFTTTLGLPLSLLSFISFFGPIIGIALGFDAINSERTQGTLSRVLAQPVYRDALFNGKFLAGFTALAIVLVSMGIGVVGLAMFRIGIAPSGEEMLRLIGFAAVGIAYLALWLAMSMTASIFLRNTVASALVSIGVWIVTSFFILIAATALAQQIVPEVETNEDALRRFNAQLWISRTSPSALFSEATNILLDPIEGRLLTPLALNMERTQGMVKTPVAAGQSLQLVWPHIVAMVAMIASMLAVSYIRFMREEIRA
jgi:ABC-2 type transport system permease protein